MLYKNDKDSNFVYYGKTRVSRLFGFIASRVGYKRIVNAFALRPRNIIV